MNATAVGRRSRRKGATFERAVAALLRAWLGEDWTVQRQPHDRQQGQGGEAGDLRIAGPSAWPWAVECKHVAALRTEHLLTVRPPLALTRAWAQAVAQAQAVGLRPMLVARTDRGTTVVVVRRPDAVALRVGEPQVRLEIDGDPVTAVPWDVWAGVGVGMIVEVTR